MTDTGQIIEVPDEMTLVALQALQDEVEGRFCFELKVPGYAHCTWVNYYEDAAGRRSKNKNGAWKLLKHQSKIVVII